MRTNVYTKILSLIVITLLIFGSAISTFACTKPSYSGTMTLACNGATSINVSWTSTTANGYIVFRSSSLLAPSITDGTNYTVGITYPIGNYSYTVDYSGSGTSYSSSGLTAKTTYYYFVFAYNNTGGGTCPAYSSSSATKGLTTAPSTAAPTASLVTGGATPITPTAFSISWTNPSSGRSAGFDYDLSTDNFSTSVSGYPKFVAASASSPMTQGYSNLQNTHTYYARVRYSSAQTNGCGGDWSNVVSTGLLCNHPDGPQSFINIVAQQHGFMGIVQFASFNYNGIIVLANTNNDIPQVKDGTVYNAGDQVATNSGPATVIYVGAASGQYPSFTTLSPVSLNPNTTYYLSAFSYMSGSPCIINYSGTWLTGQAYTTSGTVGINEFNSAQKNIIISPNPSSSVITVYNPTAKLNESAEITIYDITGELAAKENVKWSDNVSLNIKSLRQGIYFMKVKTNSYCYTSKFIKQ